MAEDFRKLLQNNSALSYPELGMRQFERISAGNFSLSIQASATHYSTPKSVLDDPHGYTEFEVAIFDTDDNWVFPASDPRFSDKEWAKGFEDFPGQFTSVGAYMPVALVQQMYEDLLNVSVEASAQEA